MAQIKDIVEEEQARNKEKIQPEIHLYQEGEFLRAYEWSAWLCCVLLHELKVTHKQFKGIGRSVAFVGFPLSSLQKWTSPEFRLETVSEKHLRLLFDEGLVPGGADDYDAWKTSIPVTESHNVSSKSVTKSTQDQPGNATLTSIMRRIMEYPVEGKSPIDSMIFLSEIKKELSRLI